jgi:NTP pyrophosphatase (non-canonical NTP hydrolase)
MPATFNDLVALMDRLRSPGGCPWDREQTYATLAPMLLEEAYEAFEAVEDAREGRPRELCDELGDLMFQIVFYAQVAKERNEFTIDDVTTAIHDKMVRRHPHVFGDVEANDAATVLLNWETMKAEERRASGKTENTNTSIDESRSRRFRLEVGGRHLREVTGRDRRVTCGDQRPRRVERRSESRARARRDGRSVVCSDEHRATHAGRTRSGVEVNKSKIQAAIRIH